MMFINKKSVAIALSLALISNYSYAAGPDDIEGHELKTLSLGEVESPLPVSESYEDAYEIASHTGVFKDEQSLLSSNPTSIFQHLDERTKLQIFSNVPSLALQLSLTTYSFITGFERPGSGLDRLPRGKGCYNRLILLPIIHFRERKVESISNFMWYCCLKTVEDLPDEFWPFLKHTGISTIKLSNKMLGDERVIEFTRNLQDTNILSIYLSGNMIRDQATGLIAQNLKGTNVQTILLNNNMITNIGAIDFARNILGSNLRKISLLGNFIDDTGIKDFAEIIQGSKINSITLTSSGFSNETKDYVQARYPNISWFF